MTAMGHDSVVNYFKVNCKLLCWIWYGAVYIIHYAVVLCICCRYSYFCNPCHNFQ